MQTVYEMHHPKADIDRLYLKRKEEGEDWCKSKGHIKQK
jgi:hypothetical protein